MSDKANFVNGRQTLRDVIGGLTGTGTYRHALCHSVPNGLRFALSEGGSQLDQVLTALRKATDICTDIFGGQAAMLVHLQMPAPPTPFALRGAIRELRMTGIGFSQEWETWITEDSGDDGHWVNCAFEAPTSKLQSLLWCALVTDFGALRPNPHCLVYLIDKTREIIVHPYDDRGMDVVCREPSRLADLREKHGQWLLDRTAS